MVVGNGIAVRVRFLGLGREDLEGGRLVGGGIALLGLSRDKDG